MNWIKGLASACAAAGAITVTGCTNPPTARRTAAAFATDSHRHEPEQATADDPLAVASGAVPTAR